MRVLWALALTFVACSSPTETGPKVAGLHFISRPQIVDTIEAKYPAGLALTVRDSALNPVAGDSVRFEAHMTTDLPNHYAGTSALSPTARYDFITTGATDATGRLNVWVRLGNQAGTGYVTATRLATSERDSISYTVHAGGAYKLTIPNADTAVWIGSVTDLGAGVFDRSGNRTPDLVWTSATGSGGTVSQAGLLTATAYGEMVVNADWVTGGGTVVGSKTGRVSIVPKGKLVVAAVRSDGRGIWALNTDGTGAHWVYKKPLQPSTPYISWPAWSPDGSKVVFTVGNALLIADAAGTTSQALVSGVAPPVDEDYSPQFSPDGVWVYYTRGSFGNAVTIWRVPSIGGATSQIGDGSAPSPNPTSDTLAFQTSEPPGSLVRLLTPGGSVTAIDVPGFAPRWSPTGGKIAYLNQPDTLHFMTPGGVLVHRSTSPVQKNFCWSPDGQWVLGVTSRAGFSSIEGYVHFINATSDLKIALPFLGFSGPSMVAIP